MSVADHVVILEVQERLKESFFVVGVIGQPGTWPLGLTVLCLWFNMINLTNFPSEFSAFFFCMKVKLEMILFLKI